MIWMVGNLSFFNESDNFRNFIFSSYRIEKIFELYHVKKILFDNTKEPAWLLVFDNKASSINSIQYFLPRLNSFAETFKTILLNQRDVVRIVQNDLLKQRIKLRDYLIGTEKELSLANKLERECISLVDLMLVDKENYDSNGGFKDWGARALEREFGETKTDLTELEYNLRKQSFLDKYYSKLMDEEHSVPFIKSAQLKRFGIDDIDTYCRDDISNFDRPRNPSIYTGEKILFSRTGGEIRASYSDKKIYFNTDIYAIKLKNPGLYHAIVCCLNSELVNYYSQIKLRKRIDGAYSKVNASDFEKIPMPKYFNDVIVEQLNTISKGILSGDYSFEEKEDEINDLVFELYELDYIGFYLDTILTNRHISMFSSSICCYIFI
jgi:hypothetical protein